MRLIYSIAPRVCKLKVYKSHVQVLTYSLNIFYQLPPTEEITIALMRFIL